MHSHPIQLIALTQLVPAKINVRKHGDKDDTNLDALTASIAHVGLLQPLVVRPAAGNTHEVVAGVLTAYIQQR